VIFFCIKCIVQMHVVFTSCCLHGVIKNELHMVQSVFPVAVLSCRSDALITNILQR